MVYSVPKVVGLLFGWVSPQSCWMVYPKGFPQDAGCLNMGPVDHGVQSATKTSGVSKWLGLTQTTEASSNGAGGRGVCDVKSTSMPSGTSWQPSRA